MPTPSEERLIPILQLDSACDLTKCTPDQLRAIRQAWDYSTYKMSTKIGVTRVAIGNYENGDRKSTHYPFAVYWMTRYAVEIERLPQKVLDLFKSPLD